MRVYIYVYLLLYAIGLHSQFYVSPNANLYFTNNVTIQINTDFTISSNATVTQSGTGYINITGNWTNNGGTFNPGTGLVLFHGNANSTIGGTSSTTFYNLDINKTNSGNDIVLVENNLQINNQLQVLNGTFRLGNSNPLRVIVAGTTTISTNGTFDVTNSLPNAYDTVKFGGDLVVNGNLDFNQTNGKAWAFFINSGNTELNGSGTVDLYEVIIEKANSSDIVAFKKYFTAPNGFLTLKVGYFRLEGTYSISNTFLKPQSSTGNCFIPQPSGFWLDNPNATVTGQPLAGNLYLRGVLRISQGTFNVGTTGESSIIYDNTTPNISSLEISGGTLNVWTRISPQTYATNLINFNQSGGIIKIGTGSNSTETSVGMFDISATGSTFNWSGGTIELNLTANNTVADYIVLASNGVVSGGTLKFDASTTNQVFDVNSSKPVYDLLMTGTNSPTVKLLNNLTILNNASVLNGTLDLQTYSANSVTGATGTFTLAANTMLRLSGTNNLANTIDNYQAYNINTTSIVDFYGTNQTISSLPANLTQDFTNNVGGLGTVWLSNSGTKLVSQPLLVRGNLINFTGVTLQNSAGVDALAVRGSVINNAAILNEGVIEIGTCP